MGTKITYLTHVWCATCRKWTDKESINDILCNVCHMRYRTMPKSPSQKAKYVGAVVRY